MMYCFMEVGVNGTTLNIPLQLNSMNTTVQMQLLNVSFPVFRDMLNFRCGDNLTAFPISTNAWFPIPLNKSAGTDQ